MAEDPELVAVRGGCQAPTQSPAHLYLCCLWSLLHTWILTWDPALPRGASLGHTDSASQARGAAFLLNVSSLIAAHQEKEPEAVTGVRGQKGAPGPAPALLHPFACWMCCPGRDRETAGPWDSHELTLPWPPFHLPFCSISSKM